MTSAMAHGVILDEHNQTSSFNLTIQVSVDIEKLHIIASPGSSAGGPRADILTAGKLRDGIGGADMCETVDFALTGSATFDFAEADMDRSLESRQEVIKFLNALPGSTRSTIKAMNSPVIMRFQNAQRGMLTENLCTDCPPWADVLHANIVKKSKSHTYLLLDVKEGFMEKLQKLHEISKDSGKALRECKSKPSTTIQFDDIDPVRMIGVLPGHKAKIMFPDLDQYMKLQYSALVLDQKRIVEEIRKWEASNPRLILISKEGSSKNKSVHYLGLIDKPLGQEFYLQTGTTLEIRFTNDPEASVWRASVTEDRAFAKKGMASVFVTRGKLPDSNVYDSRNPPCIIFGGNRESQAVKKEVANLQGKRILIKVADCDSEFTTVRRAYETINAYIPRKEKGDLAKDYQARILHILRAQRFDLLPGLDLYAPAGPNVVPGDFMDSLNDDQRKVVNDSRSIPGGLQIVQGPPGTGKTYLITQMAAPLLASKKQILTLVGAPTNRGADDLACLLRNKWQRLIDEQGLSYLSKRPVLRIINKRTELDIVRSYNPTQDLSTAQPSDTDTERKAGLNGYFQEQSATAHSNFVGIQDNRVQDIEISVGYMMLMISGLIDDAIHSQNKNRYGMFRSLHTIQKRRQLSLEESEDWNSACDTLFIAALSRASAIVGTTAGISASYTLPLVKDRVAAVFLDENAFQTEVALAPLFAADFPLNPCLVVIGDQQQISPITMAGQADNPLVSQLRLSFMARLINAGMSHRMLTEQYRMCPDILKISNSLTYGNRLTTASSAQLAQRPLARQFRQFAERFVGKETNVFMIDIPPSRTNQTTRYQGRSKGNDYSVAITTEILEKLLAEFNDTAEIAVLTPYKYQLQKHETVKTMMEKLALPNHEKVTMNSFVGSQGRQYDIVIVEIISDTHLGFIRDKKMMNVAMSRAKNGVIFICNEIALRAAINKPTKAVGDAQHLEDLLELLEDVKYVRSKQDELPSNKYFKPKSA